MESLILAFVCSKSCTLIFIESFTGLHDMVTLFTADAVSSNVYETIPFSAGELIVIKYPIIPVTENRTNARKVVIMPFNKLLL